MSPLRPCPRSGYPRFGLTHQCALLPSSGIGLEIGRRSDGASLRATLAGREVLASVTQGVATLGGSGERGYPLACSTASIRRLELRGALTYEVRTRWRTMAKPLYRLRPYGGWACKGGGTPYLPRRWTAGEEPLGRTCDARQYYL